jgi:hypothetical protein
MKSLDRLIRLLYWVFLAQIILAIGPFVLLILAVIGSAIFNSLLMLFHH